MRYISRLFGFICLWLMTHCSCSFINASAQSINLSPIKVVGQSGLYHQADAAYFSVSHLAKKSSAVDVQNRMGSGWLQDVSIRGGIFEDAQVNLNGVTLNNPQTGHFNLSLPGVSYDIDQLGIDLNRQKLNFRLRELTPEKYLRVSVGNAGFAKSIVSMTEKIGEGFHRFSIEGVRTDGLRDDTDGCRVAGSYAFGIKSIDRDILFYLSISEKHFGENGAYAAPWYLKEEEKIRQEFVMAEIIFHDRFDFTIKPYLQRTQDTFWLDRDNPTFYRNDHTSYVVGTMFEILDPETGRFIELEVQRDDIQSTNLGEYDRFFYSGETGWKTQYSGKWNYAGSVKVKYFDEFPFEVLPQLSAGYQISNFWQMTAKAECLYRQPSYTELYYTSASNQGNPDLNPQTSDNVELGLHYAPHEMWFDVDVFYRRQKDTIDWVRNIGETKHRAVNAGNVNVRGFDVGFGMQKDLLLFDKFDFSYTRLDVNKSQAYDVSKYVFDYLRDRFVLALKANRGKWNYGLTCSYEYHISLRDRWLFGAEAGYQINQDAKVFVVAENVFDEDYDEFLYIQGEPFFIKAGLELHF